MNHKEGTQNSQRLGPWENKQHEFLPNKKLVAQLSETDVRQLNPVTYDIKKTAFRRLMMPWFLTGTGYFKKCKPRLLILTLTLALH